MELGDDGLHPVRSFENTLVTPRVPTTSIVTAKIIVPNTIIWAPNRMPKTKGYNVVRAAINANNPTKISSMSIDVLIGNQFNSISSA